jgi:hypothetical protein
LAAGSVDKIARVIEAASGKEVSRVELADVSPTQEVKL